jgi:S-DNA-T family DNA segregation ATPase FtsK/SpoIIIE
MRLPRSSVDGPITPGRALVHLGNGELLTVQVPLD